MFPFCFEWAWDAAHLIFMGLLYLVLGVIVGGLIRAATKTWLELRTSDGKCQGMDMDTE
jgi:hypothetical protein